MNEWKALGNWVPNDVVMADNINLFKNHLVSLGHHANLFIHIELNHSEPEVYLGRKKWMNQSILVVLDLFHTKSKQGA